MRLAKPILNWPEFDAVCDLTLEKVVPRLLLPLQSEGRTIEPCLVGFTHLHFLFNENYLVGRPQ